MGSTRPQADDSHPKGLAEPGDVLRDVAEPKQSEGLPTEHGHLELVPPSLAPVLLATSHLLVEVQRRHQRVLGQ